MGRAEDIFKRIEDKGVAAIHEFIAEAASEELFLDFKLSKDRGANSRLAEDDLRNYSEAISGFGNSEGGVIVWGVECSPKNPNKADVASRREPIENPERFKGWLESNTSGRTLPPHPSVRHHVINAGNGVGYVVSLIVKSNYAPHQEIKSQHYYMRSGASFVKVPHGVLSGMFGRRPQACIEHKFAVEPIKIVDRKAQICLEIVLRNDGLGIGRDVFLNARCCTEIGPNSELKFIPMTDDQLASRIVYGVSFVGVACDGFKLPPTAILPAVRLQLQLEPPFTSGFHLIASCGAEGSETTHFELISTKEDVEKAHEAWLQNITKRKDEEEERIALSRAILGLPEGS